MALGIALQAGVEMVRTKLLGMRSAVKVSMKLPMPWEIVKDLLRGLFGREVGIPFLLETRRFGTLMS